MENSYIKYGARRGINGEQSNKICQNQKKLKGKRRTKRTKASEHDDNNNDDDAGSERVGNYVGSRDRRNVFSDVICCRTAFSVIVCVIFIFIGIFCALFLPSTISTILLSLYLSLHAFEWLQKGKTLLFIDAD